MYAVIETGGKQYRVEVGTELEVELLDVQPGQSITLERVLLVADGAEAAVGTPVVADAAVEAEVIGQTRGEKVIAFKYRPKARRRVKKGHRQELTMLRIADIRFNGKSAAEGVVKADTAKAADRRKVEEAAARQAAEDAALAAKLAAATTAVATTADATTAKAPAAPKRARAKAPAAPKRARAKTAPAAATPADAAATATAAPKRARAKAGTETPDAAPRKRARKKKDE
jgi:large subunit ribosomal protein L21